MKTQYIEKNDFATYYFSDKKMIKLHREDGPAIEYARGGRSWYLNGQELTETEFKQRTTKLELTIDEIAAKFNVDPKNLKIKK